MESYGDDFDKLSEEHKQLIKDFEPWHEKIIELCGDLSPWEEVSFKNGMHIYSQARDSGLKMVRAEGSFDFPASLVADYALDPEIRCEVDQLFKEARIIEDIGCGLAYEYWRMRGSFIFSDRDIWSIRHMKTDSKGRIIISAYSTEHPDWGEVSGAVRASLNIFGYVITPDADNPDKCFAQLIMEGDLKGNIPTMIANFAILANGKFLHKLNKKLKADN